MTKRIKRISFAEFGQLFMQTAVTADVLERQLKAPEAGLPKGKQPIPRTDIGMGATYRGEYEINSDFRVKPVGATPTEVVFAMPLPIHVTLFVHLVVGQENYEIDATVQLRLIAQTWAPLNIFVEIPKLTAANITDVKVKGSGNWFDLAKKFGLEQKLRDAVAEQINAETEKSLDKRDIDVADLIAQGMSGGANSTSGGEPGTSLKTARSIQRGQTLEGNLAPGQRHYYRLALKSTDDNVEFSIYGRMTAASNESAFGILKVLDAQGGVVAKEVLLVDIFGEDYKRGKLIFVVMDDGEYFITFESEKEASKDLPSIQYKIIVK